MKQLPQRKSPRLKNYDYAQEGVYFVTACTHQRYAMFGNIKDDTMLHNLLGDTIEQWWCEVANKYKDIQLDYYVVMPNHFHGIVVINQYRNNHSRTSLFDVMRWFKTMTTNAYLRGIKSGFWHDDGRLWQTSYHDHIIRNQTDLQRIRQYIIDNPAKWERDTFYVTS